MPNSHGADLEIKYKKVPKQETGNRKQETGNRKQETGNRKQETGNRKQETGNRKASHKKKPATEAILLPVFNAAIYETKP
jgi:hypothetical protein